MLASPGITNDSSLLSVCTCTDWIIIAVIVRMCEVNDTLAPLCVGYGSSVWSCQVLLSVDRSKETYEACRQWVLCARYELCLKILYYEQMRTWGGGGGGSTMGITNFNIRGSQAQVLHFVFCCHTTQIIVQNIGPFLFAPIQLSSQNNYS